MTSSIHEGRSHAGASSLGSSAARLAAAMAVVQLLAGSSTAWAGKKEDAKKKYDEGAYLLDTQDNGKALNAFLISYKLDPLPACLEKIAMCYEGMSDLPASLAYYESYEAESGDGLDAKGKKALEEKIAGMKDKVGKIEVDAAGVTGEILVDGASKGKLPLKKPLYLLPGLHEITVKDAGKVVFARKVKVEGGKVLSQKIEVGSGVKEGAPAAGSGGDAKGSGGEEAGKGPGGGGAAGDGEHGGGYDEDEAGEDDEEGEEDEYQEDDGAPQSGKGKTSGKKGTLVVTLEGDDDALVFVDGIEVGSTPWKDDLLPGEYKVEIKAPGVPGWKGKVQVRKGEQTSVSIDPEGQKKVPGTSTLFWSLLSATIPSLTAGIVFAAFYGSFNDSAIALAKELDSGVYGSGTTLEAAKMQRQHDLVDMATGMRSGAIAAFVIGGLLAAGAVSSLFIFRKHKTVSQAAIEISSASPLVDPATGTLGMSLSLSF